MAFIRKSYLLASLFMAGTLAAAEKDQDALFQMSLKELMAVKVVSASRSAESVIRAPATVRVINQTQIQQRGYHTLADVLQNAIGFDHQWASDSADFNRLGVRGIFGNNKILILQDGLRVTPATGDVIAIAENFPIHGLKQIEILYGPASALYGADALTAVVNLISINTDVNELSISTGDYGYRRGHFTTHNSINDWRIRVTGHAQQADYSELSKDFPEQYRLNDLVTFAGNTKVLGQNRQGPDFSNESQSLDIALSYGTDWQLGYNQRHFQYSTATASRPDFVDYGQNPTWESHLSNAFLRYQTEISDTLTTEINLSHNHYELDSESSFANIFVAFERGYKFTHSEQTEVSQLFKWLAPNEDRFTFGYSVQKLHSIPLTADLPQPYNTSQGPSDQNLYFPGTDDNLVIPIYDVNWRNTSAFAQWQTQWQEKLSTTVGLRYDDSSTYGSSINPRLGLVYQASEDTTIKASYGQAFLAPSPQNSYRFFGSFAFQRPDGRYQSFFFQLPNADLKAETLTTMELAWTQILSEHWLFEAVAFSNQLDQAIQPVITDPAKWDHIPGGIITTTQINDNIARLESHGTELALNYHSHWLSAWINYSFVDGKRISSDNESALPFTSRHKLRSGLTWQWQQWSLTPSLEWTSDTSLSEVGVAADKTAKGFSLVNLQLQRTNLLDGLDAAISINNLLDKSYGVAGEGSATVFSEVPQRKRWLSVELRWRL